MNQPALVERTTSAIECPQCYCLLPFVGCAHSCPEAESKESDDCMPAFSNLLKVLKKLDVISGVQLVNVVPSY